MVRKIALNKIEIIFNFFICFCVEPLSISPTSQLFLVTPPSFTHFFLVAPPFSAIFFLVAPPLNPTSPPMLIKNERSLIPNSSTLYVRQQSLQVNNLYKSKISLLHSLFYLKYSITHVFGSRITVIISFRNLLRFLIWKQLLNVHYTR